MEGLVEIRAAGGATWQAANALQAVCTGDTVAVRQRGRAAVVLPNDVLLRLDQGSVLTLKAFAPDQPSELGLLQGALHVLTRFSKRFGVVTPYLNAMVDGTEFTVQVADDATSVSVNEGQVRAENSLGQQTLTAGLSTRAGQGQAPAALTLRPLDAVQWALYFPQIVNAPPAVAATLPESAQRSVQLAEQGQYSAALGAWPPGLDALRAERAGWHLGVGRVNEAQALLQGDDSASALAVRSLIQVVRNQAPEALTTAGRAAAADPQSAAAQLALSYARQALRDLPAALSAAQQAVTLEPTHGLAWARLAELQLSSGQLRDGEASAQRALALNATTPRAATLLGFAQLLRGQTAQAQMTLQQAQTLAPSDPLPHLGMGLALLREGQLAQGRRELEIAVMLDPGDAELRSLLARAYMREKRDGLAATELTVAKGLDPLSPTPWFVDGLRKQSNHRPVEAAADYERALALNQNRAVVRPNSLLDTDRAARTASLASVWRELGFEGAMLSAARGALVDDPQSPAAHRLLAQAYAATPRYETARVSELLQAQLRQPPRTEPVAPQELVPGLPVLNGPRALALQETGPLFDEKRGGVRLGLMAGSRGLLGSSVTAWQAVGNGQISLGHFHYETDGYRDGANVKLDANNVLWQTALTPELNVQAEVRSAQREGGDITQRLLPESAAPQRQRGLESEMARLGLRYATSADSEWLVSVVRGRKDIDGIDVTRTPRLTLTTIGQTNRRHIDLAEFSYASVAQRVQWTAGGSIYREDFDNSSLTSFVPRLSPPSSIALSAQGDHRVAFAYATVNAPVRVHIGVSHDDFSRGDLRIQETRPKLGFSWGPSPGLQFRLASIQSMKGSNAKEQTLEPTQFAGFNQLFDDPDATQSKQVAWGVDHAINRSLRWGAEISRRRLDEPLITSTRLPGCQGPVCQRLWTEAFNELHWNLLLNPRWGVGGGLRFETQALSSGGAVSNVPSYTRTWQLPLQAGYFSEEGWSANGLARYVKQTVRSSNGSTALIGHAKFWVVDSSFQWRATRTSTLYIDLKNIFDREFRFQDTYISGEPRVPLFEPRRTISARAVVRF